MLWSAAAGGVAALSVICIFTLDQSVALFWAQHKAPKPLFQAMAAPSLLSLPMAGLVLLAALSQRLRGQAGPSRLWLAMALATLAATAAKDELKWMFGRAWPGTFLKFGDAGFHPFAQSVWYGAFPSGHTSYAAAPLAVLWVLRPRWRPLYAALLLAVMAGLVCADYHFVSDVLAGLLTGTFCAWGALVLTAPRQGPVPRRG
ncbi:phosphatase PAP2 family protein [Acidocella sp. MX-AZ02]|uniref:phosphatase PAP2 family protein n=1 Tax=Acidocella sp. MX-AZ02 TaxID=1214225 RepID=UPI00028CDE97|nr:phosphatase PAP2 family protein [Acidocella sp. MX-AZ02]EKM98805.1 PA-phosphatase-like phosphoesterase [Acidocella sp. MX-AZ02]